MASLVNMAAHKQRRARGTRGGKKHRGATAQRTFELLERLLPAFEAVMGVANYGATTAKGGLELLGVLDNRRVRSPLVPLDDEELAALRTGLEAAGLL